MACATERKKFCDKVTNMPVTRTVFLKDMALFPEWQVVQTYTEPAIEFYCERSNLPLDKCENVECSRKLGHRTTSRIGKVDKAIIQKQNGAE